MRTRFKLHVSLHSLLFAPAVVVLAAGVPAAGAQTKTHDPAQAQLITEDIPRFWQAFDARAELGTAVAIDSFYLKPGTKGLQDWKRSRLLDAGTMARTVDAAADYYASARASTLRAEAEAPQIRASFGKLAGLYPDAVFPDVYFVVGRLTSGGTTSSAGLLIGIEMSSRTDSPAVLKLGEWLRQVLRPVDDLPGIVAHELIHYQQKGFGGFRLIDHSLREGIADFVGEMISGFNINSHVHAWVAAEPGREQKLWAEFEPVMHTNLETGWFDSSNLKERPKDLGYYMGYKIAQAYYNKTKDKKAALRDILQQTNSDDFLKKSGYAELMRATARTPAPPK